MRDIQRRCGGRHPKEISADWGAQRVKGLSILALIQNMFSSGEKETSLIEEFWYPKYGPGQLWECVADKIEQMGGKIIKGAKVKEVSLTGDRVVSVSYFLGEKSIIADTDFLLSSMSLKDLVGCMGEAIPRCIRAIAQGLPYRDFVTVGLLVDKLSLKNETKIKTLNNIVPDCWIYVQDVGVKMGRIQIFNNWSPYLLEDVEHNVWIGLEYFCTEGDAFWEMEEEACVNFAIDELISIGLISGWEDVKKTHRARL